MIRAEPSRRRQPISAARTSRLSDPPAFLSIPPVVQDLRLLRRDRFLSATQLLMGGVRTFPNLRNRFHLVASRLSGTISILAIESAPVGHGCTRDSHQAGGI